MSVPSAGVAIRYIVNDVDAAISFYTELLDFKIVMHPAPSFAILGRDPLRLLLTKPGPGPGGGGQPMPDGAVQTPGGWNRIHIIVDDLEKTIAGLKEKKAKFRNELVVGVGGNQILLEDPSGNLIELFEYKR
jgi:catechol 2,3-dioxygenase-like lactoylglutathione lyase family enzyme